jgi:hypothetical protein
MSKAIYMVLQKETYMREVPFLPCSLNFHTLATKTWSQVAGLRVEANRKRSEFGLFIVLFQHLLGGAEGRHKTPKPVAQ